MCVQRRLRWGWASAQYDQSLRCPHELRYPLSAQRRLIRLGGFQGWSESSLGAQIILLVLSWGGSFYVGHQSYQINHISCSKNKSSIQKVHPLYAPFSAGTVCRTLPYYSTVAREKVRIVLNHRRCPRAMSSRYHLWNSSLLSVAIHTNKFYMVLASGVGISKHPTL